MKLYSLAKQGFLDYKHSETKSCASRPQTYPLTLPDAGAVPETTIRVEGIEKLLMIQALLTCLVLSPASHSGPSEPRSQPFCSCSSQKTVFCLPSESVNTLLSAENVLPGWARSTALPSCSWRAPTTLPRLPCYLPRMPTQI